MLADATFLLQRRLKDVVPSGTTCETQTQPEIKGAEQ